MSTSTSSGTSLEALGDAELISAVRGGDLDAYGTLFERHVGAARRLARQLVSAGDVEDLVSEAFIKVLRVLQRGGGPDVAFRAYLLTSVRRLRVDRLRATSRLHTTDDMDLFDPGVPFRDTAVEGFENAAAARAFASLPERWQMVLWHTEVEGSKPADVAVLLGMSPNSVSALAYRAREGLRQAFLIQHANELDEDECRWTHEHLGAYIRNGTARRDGAKVEQHLGECRSCTALYLELSDVNSNLAAVLGPLLLGGLAAAYVGQAATGGVAVSSGISAVVGRIRDVVVANTAASSVAGAVATVAVVGGAMTTGASAPDRTTPLADPPAAVATTDPVPRTPGPTPSPAPRDRPRAERAPAGSDEPLVEVALPELTDPPVAVPTETPTETPSGTPSETPSETPTGVPTGTPDKTPDETPDEVPTVEPTPTPLPTTVPTTVPTGSPTPTETPTPTPTSTPTPTEDPTDEPPPPPANVSVAAQVSGVMPNYVVSVSVSDLQANATAVLTVTATGAQDLRSQDTRCQEQSRTITCTLAGGAASPVEVAVTAPQGGTLTAEVSTTPPDADTSDNRVDAVLA